MPKIALILTPGFADWEYAYIAGTGGPFYGIDVAFFAPSPGEVVSQGGLAARVTRGTEEIADWAPEVIVAVGGTGWGRDGASDLSDVLTAQHDRGGTVAGICGGTLALARAGLLDDVRHTSNDPAYLGENARPTTARRATRPVPPPSWTAASSPRPARRPRASRPPCSRRRAWTRTPSGSSAR